MNTNDLIPWSSCAECGYPVGHDAAHPALPCGRRCHIACMAVHLRRCLSCRAERNGKATIVLALLCLALLSVACLATAGPYWTPGPETAIATATILISETAERTLTKTPTAAATLQSCARVVAIEALHLRSDPDENAIVLTWLHHGDVVQVISTLNADWWLIEYESVVGYARSMYLQESECE